jgi:hypothetical protein
VVPGRCRRRGTLSSSEIFLGDRTAQHPVRFGTRGFVAPMQSNCPTAGSRPCSLTKQRPTIVGERGDPDWGLPLVIDVSGRMLAGPSISSFRRVGENADPMGVSRVFVALGVYNRGARGWKEDGRGRGRGRAWSSAVLPASCPIQRGPQSCPNLQWGEHLQPSAAPVVG